MKTKLTQNEESNSDNPFQLCCISGKVTQSVGVCRGHVAGTLKSLWALKKSGGNKPRRVYA